MTPNSGLEESLTTAHREGDEEIILQIHMVSCYGPPVESKQSIAWGYSPGHLTLVDRFRLLLTPTGIHNSGGARTWDQRLHREKFCLGVPSSKPTEPGLS